MAPHDDDDPLDLRAATARARETSAREAQVRDAEAGQHADEVRRAEDATAQFLAAMEAADNPGLEWFRRASRYRSLSDRVSGRVPPRVARGWQLSGLSEDDDGVVILKNGTLWTRSYPMKRVGSKGGLGVRRSVGDFAPRAVIEALGRTLAEQGVEPDAQ
jgi:hypothetical protein